MKMKSIMIIIKLSFSYLSELKIQSGIHYFLFESRIILQNIIVTKFIEIIMNMFELV